MRDLAHCDSGPSLTRLEAVEELSTLWHQVEQAIDQWIDEAVGHPKEEDHRSKDVGRL